MSNNRPPVNSNFINNKISMFVILCADSQLDSNIELDSYGVPAVDAGGIKTNDGSAYHDIAQGDSGGEGGRGVTISIWRLGRINIYNICLRPSYWRGGLRSPRGGDCFPFPSQFCSVRVSNFTKDFFIGLIRLQSTSVAGLGSPVSAIVLRLCAVQTLLTC